jgi:hypothetical protein
MLAESSGEDWPETQAGRSAISNVKITKPAHPFTKSTRRILNGTFYILGVFSPKISPSNFWKKFAEKILR